ncbi:MAG TPA: trypsin-like peptidase domain-containing protein [Dehalococcoidia bacterium]|nr:trypsin-like peptidase domain-containing protein [Dehalococcoidia bacterium]
MSEILANLSDALAATVEQSSSSVVRIEGRHRLPASGVVWSADGVIVTAHHVLEQDENIHVGLPDGQTVLATLVGRDPTTDLAVLKVGASDLKTPQWLDAENLKVGNLALALGRPGQRIRATLGIVSAVGQGWQTPTGGAIDHYLQSDVTMYPGFSGGPMVDSSGRFLGVNSSALVRGGTTITIPTATVRRVAETLLSHGHIRRGYLGVGAQPTRLPATIASQLGQETGLLLVSVEPNSPAEQAKLYMGDTIVALAGKPVRHLDDLFATLSGDRVDTAVPVKFLRGGQTLELSVTIGERTQ